MEIFLEICFDESKSTVKEIASKILSFPSEIRPLYYDIDDERYSKKNIITNTRSFEEFMDDNIFEFCLIGDKCSYCIETIREMHELRFSTKDTSLLPQILPALIEFSSLGMLISVLCDFEEFEYRNRFKVFFSYGSKEGWVGRQLENSIPGLFWVTVISDEFLSKFNIDLKKLQSECVEYRALENNTHFLKFYDHIDEWRAHTPRINELCETSQGIFSRKKFDSEIASKKPTNEHEFYDIRGKYG